MNQKRFEISWRWLGRTCLWSALALGLVACQPLAYAPASPPGVEAEAQPDARPATQIVYALYQEPEILNPYLASQTVASEVRSLAVEGLLGLDPEGANYPELAATVPALDNGGVSADGLTVRYVLRPDVRWSDGAPFTCDDLAFTFEAVMHPDSGAVRRAGWDRIARVTCADDYRATVEFAEFYAPFLGLFFAILPRHATGDPAAMPRWDYNRRLVGTGPFRLADWVSGDHILLEANPFYRDYPAKPQVDRIVVRIVPSREVGKALIRSGEVHILRDLTEADTPEFKALPDIRVEGRPSPRTERLLLNLADPTLDATDDPLNHPHPLLGDRRVRRALEMSIDKRFLVDNLLFGATNVAASEIGLGWAACDIEPSVYDPAAAAALLAEAGFADRDGDGIRECHGCRHAAEGVPLRLKIQTTAGNQLREDVQALLIEMLAAVGVDMYVENVPSSVLFGSWSNRAFRKRGQFDILMYTTTDGIDPHSHMEAYFHSARMPTAANRGVGNNYSRWVNADADAWLAQAGATPDRAVRAAAYQKVCELIQQEAPHIYLYDRGDLHAVRANVAGFAVNPWANETWNAEEWRWRE